MNLTSNYTMSEIDEFIKAHKIEEEKSQSNNLKKLLNVHNKIAIFKNIDPIYLKAIIYDLKFLKYNYKDYIIRENDKSKDIFFLIEGECQVFHKEKKVGILGAGNIFGESGVIFKTERNASVVCASKTATLLSFKIDEDSSEFTGPALAILYKNLAFQINTKLEELNDVYIHKHPF